VGLIGPNGAARRPALNAIVGLTRHEGELKVLGRTRGRERDRLMREVCFITMSAVLPRWLRVSQALDYVAASIRDSTARRRKVFWRKTTIGGAAR
jgi:ABC-2 type transport system ATP-binding protein